MLDPLLRPFVEAVDERDAERELNTLIERHALPLANAIVSRKLRSFAAAPSGVEAQDREDVVSDAMLMVVERLRRARSGGDDNAIDSFERYAASVIYSACAHQIRRRHPARARLKNRLRYVFSTDLRLALWNVDDELVCGLAEWRGRQADAPAEDTLRRRGEADERDWSALERGALTRAVFGVAAACGAPIRFDAFVAGVARRVVEPRDAADALPFVSSPAPAQDHVVGDRHFLELVWREVRELPLRQRVALLLNLRDGNGSGILWLLPVAGVATIRQIARVLDMPDRDFAALWRDIPLDDVAIGERLGCTRQQVINLRMSARKRLLNRVAHLLGPAAGAKRPRANLTPVSASMKGRA